MINIILTILKVIAIIILCILGILLFVVLSVLLIPIRYYINGKYENDFCGYIKFTWLFHILSFSFSYVKKTNLKIKVFGIPISVQKKAKAKKKTSKIPKVNSSNERSNLQNCNEIETDKISYTQDTDDISQITDKSDGVKQKKCGKLSLWEKFLNVIQKIQNRVKEFISKIKKIIENIEFYIDIINSMETKAAISTCKKRLIKLYKIIKLNKLKVKIYYGLEDPANTAKILSFYSILYPYIGNSIDIFPNFEESVFKAYIK